MKAIPIHSGRWLCMPLFFIAVFVLVSFPGEPGGVCGAAGQYLDETAENEPIYGAERMSNSEIEAYRKRIRECPTAAQRQEFRNQHRKQVQERVQQRNKAADSGELQERSASGSGSGAMGSNTTVRKRGGGGNGGGRGWKRGGKR